MNDLRRKFGHSVLAPLVYGLITGVLCGAFIALFLICARVTIDFSFGLYKMRDSALFVVCLLILALMCCLITAVVQTLCPDAKGSGIPLAEGCARGMLRVKWLRTAAALIVGSLSAFLCGMPLGSEGPSVGIGGLIGEGVGKTAKKPVEFRRYLITGGASAGLATAFNAPLTGVCFAFEETHRRFSTHILASAFSAVIAAVITSQCVFLAFGQIPYLNGLGIKAGFTVLPFLRQTAYKTAADMFKVCGAALLCGSVCALLGVGFNRLTAVLAPLFGKIKSASLRLLPAFILAVVCGLSLYLTAGSGEAALAEVGTEKTFLLLVLVLAVRFVSTATASSAGSTGGLFLPMIAIGGLTGTIAAKLCLLCGMNDAYTANIVIMCISAFFAASVRAPITAVALSAELTSSFVNLLPCIIAVTAAAIISDLSGTQPLYERMLDGLKENTPPIGAKTITVRGAITLGSPIAYMSVRNILWPYNSLVTELERGGEQLVPDGETQLMPGDRITVRAENVNPELFTSQINEYIEIKPDDQNTE